MQSLCFNPGSVHRISSRRLPPHHSIRRYLRLPWWQGQHKRKATSYLRMRPNELHCWIGTILLHCYIATTLLLLLLTSINTQGSAICNTSTRIHTLMHTTMYICILWHFFISLKYSRCFNYSFCCVFVLSVFVNTMFSWCRVCWEYYVQTSLVSLACLLVLCAMLYNII